jgi:hypothetical protein
MVNKVAISNESNTGIVYGKTFIAMSLHWKGNIFEFYRQIIAFYRIDESMVTEYPW